MALKARFRGVRGSVPVSGPARQEAGGNTPCVELRVDDDLLLVLDAGTGIVSLGEELDSGTPGGEGIAVPLLLSHFHWDHIQGLPFFAPLYREDTAITVYAASATTEVVLTAQMAEPFFSVGLHRAGARLGFEEIGESAFRVGEAEVLPFPLHHPGGATGFRVRVGERSLVYATDREPGDTALDALLVERCRGADVLITDAQFTPEEYEERRGWGHSTWKDAAELADRAGVGRLYLFHHAPEHDDDRLEEMLTRARELFPATELAVERTVVEV